jgi:WXG100 family type VII secretion target
MSQQGTMTIDTAVMLRAAQTIETQRAIIANCISSIVRDGSSLKSVWDGKTADDYQKVIAEIEKESPNLVSIFHEYALDLDEIARSFMTKEQIRKAQSEALPGDIFGE